VCSHIGVCVCVWVGMLGRGHTEETGNCNATETSEIRHRFQAGNWFPDQQAHTEETYV
jgi:hypothetical protein